MRDTLREVFADSLQGSRTMGSKPNPRGTQDSLGPLRRLRDSGWCVNALDEQSLTVLRSHTFVEAYPTAHCYSSLIHLQAYKPGKMRCIAGFLGCGSVIIK